MYHSWWKQVKLGHLLIHSIYAQTPILARLALALISVDLTPVSLETRRAGASEAAGVAKASAAIEARLWLTVVNVDLTSGSWWHESGERCQRYDSSCHSDRQADRQTGVEGGNAEKAFAACDHSSTFILQQRRCKNNILHAAFLMSRSLWCGLILMPGGDRDFRIWTVFRAQCCSDGLNII